jgi:predicted nuclease of predicted toxin-antitoxin system
MNLQILIDMNLSPTWTAVLQRHGWRALHWSSVGDPRAGDRVVMDWAVANGFIIFTHDLDFGTTLALTHATGPSVIQVRSEDVLSERFEEAVLAALRQHARDLEQGALVVVELSRNRVRVLPI